MAGREINIDNINIQVSATDSASSTIDAVIGKVNELKTSLKEMPKAKFSAAGLENIKNTLSGISRGDAGKVKSLASALDKLSTVKIPASIGNNLKRIAVGLSQVTAAANGADIGAISSTVQKVASAATVSKAGDVASQPAQDMQGTAESTEDAANEMGRYASEAEEGANNTKDIKNNAKDVEKNVGKASEKAKHLTRHFKKSHGALHNLLRMVLRRVLYRSINAVISAITGGVRTGIQNLYQYSKMFNGTFAKSMDTLSTETLYLKNSLGAAFAPLIEVATPYIQLVIDKFVDLLDIINQVVSRLQGKDTWTHAVKVQKQYADAATESTKANKELKKSILGLDEINALSDNSNNDTSSSKSSDPGYETMFVTEKMDTKKIDGIIKKLTTIWNIVKWIGIAFLGWKIAKGVGSVLGIVGSLFGMGGGASAGGGVGGLFKGLLGFAGVIGVLTGIISALGALTLIDGFTEVLNAGAEVFVTLFKTVGRAVGAIIEGFITQISEGFPIIAENISQFMINLQPFIEGCKNIDSSTLTAIQVLSEAIALLTAANFLNAITNFITFGLGWEVFGQNIVTMGGYIKQFADIVTGLNLDAVIKGGESIKILAQAAAGIPNSGGLLALFVGDNNIGLWAMQLPIAGKGLKDFSDNLNGLNVDNVKVGSEAIKILSDAAKQIPNSGGLWGFFAGNNDIGKWAEQLPTAGKGLKSFSDSMDGMNNKRVKTGADALESLAEAASKIPNSGGLFSWFTGDNDLTVWVEKLPTLASGLVNFSNNLVGMNYNLIKTAADALTLLANAASEIPNAGGMLSWFTGENNIDTFGSWLPQFGTDLKNFSTNAAGISLESVTVACNSLKLISEAAKTVPNSGGMASWFAGENNVDTFGSWLPDFGTNLKKFSDNSAGIIYNNIVIAMDSLKYITEAVKSIPNAGGIASWFAGENNIDTFGQWLGNGRDGNKGFGENLKKFFDDTSTLTTARASEIKTVMTSIIDWAGRVKNEVDVGKINTFGQALFDFAGNVTVFGDSTTAVETSFTSFLNKLLYKFESFSNRIRDGLNSLMQDMANGIASFTVNSDNSVSFNTVPTGIVIPKFYATGGFPRQGEMFVANESGAELVGQIGNRTAVANSQQIVEGIKLGVQSANDESNQLLREQNNLLASLLAKDSNVRVSDIITGLRQYNRRVGKTVIEVN